MILTQIFFRKHIDFFPRHYSMQRSDATELRAHLEWFLAGEKHILYHAVTDIEE